MSLARFQDCATLLSPFNIKERLMIDEIEQSDARRLLRLVNFDRPVTTRCAKVYATGRAHLEMTFATARHNEQSGCSKLFRRAELKSSLIDVLRKTLIEVQQNSEFSKNEPAIFELRRHLAKAIGELEILNIVQRTKNSPNGNQNVSKAQDLSAPEAQYKSDPLA